MLVEADWDVHESVMWWDYDSMSLNALVAEQWVWKLTTGDLNVQSGKPAADKYTYSDAEETAYFNAQGGILSTRSGHASSFAVKTSISW